MVSSHKFLVTPLHRTLQYLMRLCRPLCLAIPLWAASGESYQVTAAMPSKLRNRLGLEPGDKVISVNGQNVGNNPAQDASVLQQVQQAGEAQIEVQRGDQVITIRQQF